MWFLENAWLIPVIPTIGFFVILLLGKRMPLKGAEIGFGTLAASFVLACGTVYQWIQRVDHYSAGHEGRSARWPPSGVDHPRPAAGQTEGRPRGRLLRAAGHPSVDVVAGERLQVHPRHPGRRPVRLRHVRRDADRHADPAVLDRVREG